MSSGLQTSCGAVNVEHRVSLRPSTFNNNLLYVCVGEAAHVITFGTTAGDFSDCWGHSWSLESVFEAESRPIFLKRSRAGAVLTWASGGPPSSLMSSRWLWPSTTISFLKRPPAETTAASERQRAADEPGTDGGWWRLLYCEAERINHSTTSHSLITWLIGWKMRVNIYHENN